MNNIYTEITCLTQEKNRCIVLNTLLYSLVSTNDALFLVVVVLMLEEHEIQEHCSTKENCFHFYIQVYWESN